MATTTIFCIDNSDSVRNGDLYPTRLSALQEAVNQIALGKLRSNPESDIALLGMAGKRPVVLVPRCRDVVQFQRKLFDVQPSGSIDLVTSLRIAVMLHRTRRNRGQFRIMVFIGSLIAEQLIGNTAAQLTELAKDIQKNNLSVDIVVFGSMGEVEQMHDLLVSFVASIGDGSQLISVPSSNEDLIDLSSAIFMKLNSLGGTGTTPGLIDYDPDDHQLEEAIRLSLLDQRADRETRPARPESPPSPAGSTGSASPASPASSASSSSPSAGTSNVPSPGEGNTTPDTSLAKAMPVKVSVPGKVTLAQDDNSQSPLAKLLKLDAFKQKRQSSQSGSTHRVREPSVTFSPLQSKSKTLKVTSVPQDPPKGTIFKQINSSPDTSPTLSRERIQEDLVRRITKMESKLGQVLSQSKRSHSITKVTTTNSNEFMNPNMYPSLANVASVEPTTKPVIRSIVKKQCETIDSKLRLLSQDQSSKVLLTGVGEDRREEVVSTAPDKPIPPISQTIKTVELTNQFRTKQDSNKNQAGKAFTTTDNLAAVTRSPKPLTKATRTSPSRDTKKFSKLEGGKPPTTSKSPKPKAVRPKFTPVNLSEPRARKSPKVSTPPGSLKVKQTPTSKTEDSASQNKSSKKSDQSQAKKDPKQDDKKVDKKDAKKDGKKDPKKDGKKDGNTKDQ